MCRAHIVSQTFFKRDGKVLDMNIVYACRKSFTRLEEYLRQSCAAEQEAGCELKQNLEENIKQLEDSLGKTLSTLESVQGEIKYMAKRGGKDDYFLLKKKEKSVLAKRQELERSIGKKKKELKKIQEKNEK